MSRGTVLLVSFVTLLPALSSGAPAVAAEPSDEQAPAGEVRPVDVGTESPRGIRIDVLDDNNKGSHLLPGAGKPKRTSTDQPAYTGPTIVATELQVLDDGTTCASFSSVPGEPGSPAGIAAFDNAIRLGGADTVCPDSPVDAAGQATPAGAAARVWHELVELSDPTLFIAPGKAITGLPAFLEISGDQTQVATFGPDVALGYEVTIEASSTYEVDWGDGKVVTGIETQGGPYPHGEIAHNYQHVDDDNVVSVTQHWTASWTATANGQSFAGVIEEPLYTEAAFPLAIGEIQAVRNY